MLKLLGERFWECGIYVILKYYLIEYLLGVGGKIYFCNGEILGMVVKWLN